MSHTPKLCLSGVLKYFRRNLLKTSFGSKIDLYQKEVKNYSQKIFSNNLEKRHILREILMETTFFGRTIEKGQILTKTVFLLKMSHIQLDYAFQVF